MLVQWEMQLLVIKGANFEESIFCFRFKPEPPARQSVTRFSHDVMSVWTLLVFLKHNVWNVFVVCCSCVAACTPPCINGRTPGAIPLKA
ncbi:hypothetical protein WN51_13280 [Melipona quadrifasciata]|uniref:Uncharacterized protein n=1 Tax=Melipona quadrifasciata TaxID=166423 RepID=A0A0M9A3R1_9HYME|nr:hypothetical protein WN51_13280 [Melipona quadrifasciata]